MISSNYEDGEATQAYGGVFVVRLLGLQGLSER